MTAERTIAVMGHASVSAEPDIAHLNLGVISEAATARDALAANSTAMRTIVDTLKAQGIAPKDIQTANFSINPRYRPQFR